MKAVIILCVIALILSRNAQTTCISGMIFEKQKVSVRTQLEYFTRKELAEEHTTLGERQQDSYMVFLTFSFKVPMTRIFIYLLIYFSFCIF